MDTLRGAHSMLRKGHATCRQRSMRLQSGFYAPDNSTPGICFRKMSASPGKHGARHWITKGQDRPGASCPASHPQQRKCHRFCLNPSTGRAWSQGLRETAGPCFGKSGRREDDHLRPPESRTSFSSPPATKAEDCQWLTAGFFLFNL